MLHRCIKPGCGREYEDAETDAYYCGVCLVDRKRIAVEIDARLGVRTGRKVVSDLQAFDASAVTMVTPDGRTATFQKVNL